MYLKDFLNFIEENKNMINLDTCKIKFAFDCKIDNLSGDILTYSKEISRSNVILDRIGILISELKEELQKCDL